LFAIALTPLRSLCFAAGRLAQGGQLANLANSKFPNLTRCERAVLENADVRTSTHGFFPPPCGPSLNFDDPSNDPKHAATWDHQRDLRADLIRWLFVEPEAVKQVDPLGVRALGARVVGAIDLANVRAPYGLVLARSGIPGVAHFDEAEIENIILSGSHTGEISAGGSRIRGVVWLNNGFEASAAVNFAGARVGLDIDCRGGSFRYSEVEHDDTLGERPALFLGASRVDGPIWLAEGFKANGVVDVNHAVFSSLWCHGGRFTNPGRSALNAAFSSVAGLVWLGKRGTWDAMEADGLIQFDNAWIGGAIFASGLRIVGKSGEPHGFSATNMSAGGNLILTNLELQNGGTVDLRGASVNGLIDDENSWPAPGALAVDGFVYKDFYGGPLDARSRLLWVGLASGSHPSWLDEPSGFQPQPYQELARVLRERGDDTGATKVLISQADARFSQYGPWGRAWGAFLKYTIAYGHRPMLTVMWSLAVMFLGWAVVASAKAASVMRPTYPENTPPNEELHYQALHPLLYSLDVFLPFVNMHQERYWWPDGDASGNCVIFRRSVSLRGSVVEYYLWAQIIAGWILSAIFVAGVTGLIRND